MSLRNELKASGNWLFRYRSYLPIILFPYLIYFKEREIPSDLHFIFLSTGIIISYFGELIRIITIAFVPPLTSGRNTKRQYASSLNTTGIYSTVRHPLYLGNYFILLGPCIYTGNIYANIIFTLIFWIYYERIMFAEEEYLREKFDDKYIQWAAMVPAFIPSFKKYISPKGSFSLIQILEREYTGICGIICMFMILIISCNIIENVEEWIPDSWKILIIINGLLYISLRTVKKNKRKTQKR